MLLGIVIQLVVCYDGLDSWVYREQRHAAIHDFMLSFNLRERLNLSQSPHLRVLDYSARFHGKRLFAVKSIRVCGGTTFGIGGGERSLDLAPDYQGVPALGLLVVDGQRGRSR